MTSYVAKVIIVGALLIALAILLTACAVYAVLRTLFVAGRAVACWLSYPAGFDGHATQALGMTAPSPDDLVIAAYERELRTSTPPLSDSYLAPGEDF